MDEVFVKEVIICTKERRGNGKDDPIRVILQVFTKEGELIAESDPCACPMCGKFNCLADHKNENKNNNIHFS